MFGKRILLLIPHPDDEVVACAATIGRAQKDGAKIFALYLTHGCLARDVMWSWQRRHHDGFVARRRAEAEDVARVLNLETVGAWPTRPARQLWRELPQIVTDVREAITTHVIDQIWVPAYEGGNADHDGLNAVGRKLATQINVSVLEFAEYNFNKQHICAQTFPLPNGTEHVLALSPEEQNRKKALLKMYASEQGNLDYVGTTQESFRPLVLYDYGKPPHDGTLWYARFQWVPFRHPRVDFTKSTEVSAAIGAFLRDIGK